MPKYVQDLLPKKFSADEVEIITKNWNRFSNGLSFGSSTAAQIVREARMVLACSKSH